MIHLITRLRYGNTNTFFIKGTSGGLLVDTDYAGTLPHFYKEIKRNSINLKDITYVLATHYHPDHIGLVSELMEHGVKLLLMDTQSRSVHYADEIFKRDSRLQYKPIDEREATIVSCKDSRTFLNSIGIAGEILSTPSHSVDSVSLILDDGTCMVGDLEPIEYMGAYDNNVKLEEDWDLVMKYNPKRILYAHALEELI
ncbi:MAG: MBL fold metallo-hydrolase [Lachnospira sp.]|nr:MBL fold metallo-hydrolase [Lachnospira sp.]